MQYAPTLKRRGSEGSLRPFASLRVTVLENHCKQMGKITLDIERYDPDKKTQFFQSFQIPWEKRDMTVLEGLFYIQENLDDSLSFRTSCRSAVCGSCAMHINGQHRLACNTLFSALKTNKVTIKPLAHLPVQKDLCVDMSPFWEKYEKTMPYLMPGSPPPEEERIQSEGQRAEINVVIDCIQCACCYSSCPVTLTSKDYLGPAALLKIDRFLRDSRDEAKGKRLETADSPFGVWRCHNVYNCQRACPKKLDPPRSIVNIKRGIMGRELRP